MGIIAESMVSYAQPFIDETDGSLESMNKAMMMAQMCWNLAVMPEDTRETVLEEVKPSLNMSDEEFDEFREQLIVPMIRRHVEMFPGLHGRSEKSSFFNPFGDEMLDDEAYDDPAPALAKDHSAGRNTPCPCGSGRKYKKCCGARH